MIAIVIQARMNSTRLPGKVMQNICGHPLLFHVAERCRRAKRADRVLVATSTSMDDDVISDFCVRHGFACYRGPRDDVLGRYFGAALASKADSVVRITGDCPLINPAIIDECIEAFSESKADYISNVNPIRTFPRGLDVEVFSFRALERAHREATLPYEREHVTPYLWENKKSEFTIGPSVIASLTDQVDARLSVDYPEDLDVIKKIYAALYREGEIVDIKEALRFLREHPEIAALNARSKQKSLIQ